MTFLADRTPDWCLGSRPWCVMDFDQYSATPYTPVIYLNKEESAEKIAKVLNDDES
jgi:hypothetical protein